MLYVTYLCLYIVYIDRLYYYRVHQPDVDDAVYASSP